MTPPLVLFDGYCTLCSWSVQFILQRDPAGIFRFAALDAPAARARVDAWQRRTGTPSRPTTLPDSVLLLDDDGLHVRSEAALRIAARLTGPWPLLARLARLVPRALRDTVYELIARHRYRWFGRRETCLLPTPEQRERFLTD
jgi:predicted DCC family thiol-disulfide oxidoreductase YuxK